MDNQELPKGAVRGLAKILWPLCLWMAAGWYAYPYLIERILTDAGEPFDLAEINAFSMFAVAGCIITGIALLAYAYSGPEADDAAINAMDREKWPCPHCLTPQPADADTCEKCGKFIEK